VSWNTKRSRYASEATQLTTLEEAILLSNSMDQQLEMARVILQDIKQDDARQ